MKIRLLIIIGFLIIVSNSSNAQNLKNGFDKNEYADLISLLSKNDEDEKATLFTFPKNYDLVYTSPTMGFDNLWDLWLKGENTAVVGVRGSTNSTLSWLCNFYAAMSPAKGVYTLSNGKIVNYKLAENPKAAIHSGWLIASLHLADDMVPKLNDIASDGITNIYLAGHSQGGAISYLLLAHFLNLQKEGKLNANIQFKTYASAAPKPGNLFFAYEFESKTQNGSFFNVINALDWIPELSFTVQTIDDLSNNNPLTTIDQKIKDLSFIKKFFIKHYVNRVVKPTNQSRDNLNDLFVNQVFKIIKKQFPEINEPTYVKSMNYVRTGNHHILIPNKDYLKIYPEDSENAFQHHMFSAYRLLTK